MAEGFKGPRGCGTTEDEFPDNLKILQPIKLVAEMSEKIIRMKKETLVLLLAMIHRLLLIETK